MARKTAEPLFSLAEMAAMSPGQMGHDDQDDYDDQGEPVKKRWISYIPFSIVILLLLSPQPSIIIFLTCHFLLTPGIRSPTKFTVHIAVIYTLMFMACSSLMVCVVRDPGRPRVPLKSKSVESGTANEEEEVGLMIHEEDDDYTTPGKWCHKCWAPKYERTHHCSTCGRCVLKMDHHCLWLANKCIGHRTYPAFIHFLTCVTMLAGYIGFTAFTALWWSFYHPFDANPTAPIHEVMVGFEGVIFFLFIGSFLLYHLYLVSMNQTTIEAMSPFMLLRHVPPLYPNAQDFTPSRLSSPPMEHELSYDERVLVRDAHRHVKLYNRGFKANWAAVFGSHYGSKEGRASSALKMSTSRWLLMRLWYGGSSPGDGKKFEWNDRAHEQLDRLARELVKLEAARR